MEKNWIKSKFYYSELKILYFGLIWSIFKDESRNVEQIFVDFKTNQRYFRGAI